MELHLDEAARRMGYEVVEDDVIKGMCCDCAEGGPCCDFSENEDCHNRNEDGSCWRSYTEKEEPMERPFVCNRLGVEVGEWFQTQMFDEAAIMDDVYFCVKPDGTFKTNPPKVAGSAFAFLRTLEHPESIIRKPRFTEEEIIAIRLIGGSYLARDMDGALSVWNSRPEWENGAWSYVMDWEERACGLPGHLFPGVKNGECVNIEEYTFA